MRRNSRQQNGHWESFDDIDGLGHECRCLLEDKDSRLWIGTSSGLSRYDAVDIVHFTERDGLPGRDIGSILQDKSGNLWVATNNGLSRYDGQQFTNFRSTDGLASDNVWSLYEDREGILWIGTNNGLSRYDGQQFVDLTKQDGLPSNQVLCVYQDQKGYFWIGTLGGGLSRYDGDEFVNFTTADGLAGGSVWCLHEDSDGILWIGTSNGLNRYDGRRLATLTTSDGLASNNVHSLCQDREGNLWVGALGGGASRYDGNEFVNFTTEHGLAHNDVLDIIQDREGSLWFACYHGGISRYNPYEISYISDETVREVMIRTRDGNLWWGSGRTLSRFDGREITHYPFEHEIFELFEDSRGQFWVGTNGGGIFRYDRCDDVGRVTEAGAGQQGPDHLFTQNGLPNDRIIKIREDHEGNIWIGTRYGLARYNGSDITNLTTDDGLGTNLVSAICQDSDGTLWFGGWAGGGITSYEAESFHTYTTDHGLVNNRVICIMEGGKGQLCIGTAAGFSCYAAGSFKGYTTEDGLSGEFVQRMLQDRKGQLWIATLGGGVSRFDGRNFQSLTVEDGLPSNCVTGVVEDADGSMVLSTYRGVCRYVPDYNISPLVRIAELDADRIYRMPEVVQMPESVASVRIRYHGISFKTKKMRYNVILEGHDQDWRATWDEEIRYENLPIGEYTFKVVAINRDLVYSEQPAELRLTVVPDERDQVISELEQKVRERTRELRTAKDYIDNVMKSMADSLIVINQDGTIRTVNQATLNLLGYQEEELIGRPFEMILVDEADPADEARLGDLIERDFLLDIDKEFVRNVGNTYLSKDGKKIPVLFSGSIMRDDHGEIQGIVCVAQDITERKRAEEELRRHRDHLEELVQERTEELKRQQQQLMQADKLATLGILSSGVAHEINNPNNFVLLNARILSRTWNDVMPILSEYYEAHGDFALAGMPYTQAYDKIDELISGMLKGSQRITRIVQGLKDYARHDTGDLNQSVDINEVVEAAILITNNLIKKSTDHFSCEYGSNLPRVRGNPQQLEQVVINLLTNACQAVGDRRNGICISTSYIPLSESIVVEVHDDGTGITSEDLRHVMDPFFTTKRNSGGTGLGLSISYNIVKAHGGDLAFTSEVGKGTTVVLTLPMNHDVEEST